MQHSEASAAGSPRLLLVTRNFPPLTGGMERLVHNIFLHLSGTTRCALLGPDGCARFATPGTTVVESRLNPAPLFLLLSFLRGLRLLWGDRRPAVVFGGSGLVAPVVWLLARLCGARTVVLVHGLDLVVNSRIYQWFWIPFLRSADAVIANSGNTARLAAGKGVPHASIHTIHPGVNLPMQVPERTAARAALGLSNGIVLLSVGRLASRKGIAEFIDRSLPGLVQKHPDTLLIVAGSEPLHALRRNPVSETDRIHAAIEARGLGENVKLWGPADDADLQRLYAAADVFVFPLLDVPGDVEGFGMVAVEAAAHGTPTVAFACGGVPDAVLHGHSGYLIDPGDYARFSAAVLEACSADMRETCRQFAERFSWSRYHRELDACLHPLLNAETRG